MKKNYIKPEIGIEFVEIESLLAASPTITVRNGEDVETASADSKEHNSFDAWE